VKTAVILGITSDIGRELALRLELDGWQLVGTYRGNVNRKRRLGKTWTLIPCELASPASVRRAAAAFHERKISWDLLIVAAGTEEPIGDFFDCDAKEWERGFTINALAPLRLLREIYGLRRARRQCSVALFSGSGTNNAAPAYSAYCASKILLIKMAELLDAECRRTNFFVIGPGIVRTKIHQQTLVSPKKSGANYKKVVDFLRSATPGTSHDEIYRCLTWCVAAGKAVVGGRNVALVNDGWRDGGAQLASALRDDVDLYKLRRHGNQRKFTRHP
jgi:NAD(P)-dependent dehydrogenase (short-subunit alcohol dehydrogenase family)